MSDMSDIVKSRSTEQLVLDAIFHIELFRKKSTTIEEVCNIIASQETGLSKEDAVEMITQMHKEGVLYIKRCEAVKSSKGKNVEGE